MWRNIIGQATCQLITLFFLLYLPHTIPFFGLDHPSKWDKYHMDLHQTLIFNTFVWCQIFNEFNARKLGNELNIFDGLFGNTTFIGVLIFTVTVQFLIVQFAGVYASCVPLTTQQWFVCVLIGAVSIPVGFVLRLIPVSTTGNSTKPKDLVDDIKAHSVMSLRDAARQIIIAQRMIQKLKRAQQKAKEKLKDE